MCVCVSAWVCVQNKTTKRKRNSNNTKYNIIKFFDMHDWCVAVLFHLFVCTSDAVILVSVCVCANEFIREYVWGKRKRIGAHKGSLFCLNCEWYLKWHVVSIMLARIYITGSGYLTMVYGWITKFSKNYVHELNRWILQSLVQQEQVAPKNQNNNLCQTA